MPNAVVGFDAQGRMWMDQGVDVRASDASAAHGVDGWGSMWAYECKGCSAGCLKNLRTAGSSYKGIRRVVESMPR